MTIYKSYFEPGRLCVIEYGPDYGKLCFVIDILNENRVLVDSIEKIHGIKRQVIPTKRLSLTDLKLKLPRGVRTSTLRKAAANDDIIARFNESTWGKKRLAKERRANLTDFERFKLMVIKKQRKQIMKTKIKALK